MDEMRLEWLSPKKASHRNVRGLVKRERIWSVQFTESWRCETRPLILMSAEIRTIMLSWVRRRVLRFCLLGWFPTYIDIDEIPPDVQSFHFMEYKNNFSRYILYTCQTKFPTCSSPSPDKIPGPLHSCSYISHYISWSVLLLPLHMIQASVLRRAW